MVWPSPHNLAARDLSESEQIGILRGLVSIPSTSRNEAEAVDYLCRWMTELGFEAGPDEAGSAVGRIGSGERHIVLLGHIDTVPGDIKVRVENNVRLYGRGAVDAKGPLATFVCAAAAASQQLNARVTVVGAVGEESIGSPGATAVSKWPAPTYCVIGEPSGWDAVCLGYRGTLSTIYRLKQESRHFAGPGESAAEQAVTFWNSVTAETARRNEGATNNFSSHGATLRSMGASGDGMIDESWMSIGVRTPPGADVDSLVALMTQIAAPAELTIEGKQAGYRTDKKSPIVPPFLRSIRAEGGTPRFTLKLGTSDMTVVGPVWNCPIVAYGPGDASLDHTPNEHIVLEEYLAAIRVLTQVLVAL